jgi:hypothetical protein
MPDDQRTAEIEKRIDRDVAGAMTIHQHGSATFSVVPRSMGEVLEFAKLMSVSGICIRPIFRGNPGACLAITIQAMKWGADPFAVANKAFVVNDQLSYESQLINAVVNASPALAERLHATFSGDGQQRQCLIVGIIKGESEAREYLSPKIADITPKNSPLWKTDPDQQLFYYSSRAWARRWVPEILLGIYAPDELMPAQAELVPTGPPPPRPRREDFVDHQAEHVAEDHPDDKPFFFTDADGEVHEFADPTEAFERFQVPLWKAAKSRGEDGINGLWESNGALLSALREHGHAELADGLNTYCGDLLAVARAEAATVARALAAAETNAKRQVHTEGSNPAIATPAPANSPAAQPTRKDDGTDGRGGPAAAGEAAPPTPELAALIAAGDERAARGTESMQSWWEHGLSALQRGSLGARGRGVGPYMEAWKIKAAAVDAAQTPAEAAASTMVCPQGGTCRYTQEECASGLACRLKAQVASQRQPPPTIEDSDPLGLGIPQQDTERRVPRPAPPPAAAAPAPPAPPAPAAADRPNLAIEPVMRNGKPDWRAWTIALFLPLLRKFNDDVADLAFFLGDNEGNITKAKAAGFKDEITVAVEAQYRVVDGNG